MFGNLVASGGRRRGPWTTRTAVVSVGLHAAVLTGVLYASVRPPEAAADKEEEVTFLEIEEEKAPEPERPEPPPPPPDVAVAPPVAKGFQELVPPEVPPPHIPPPNLSEAAVSAEDYSGVGVAGGKADGVEGAPPMENPPVDPGFAYEVAVLDAPPKLSNVSQVQSVLSRLYPSLYRDAGVAGNTMLRFEIDAEGRVDAATVQVISSTHEPFAAASLKAIEKFRFKPGRYQGQAVRVLIQMPISWQPQR